MKLAVVVTTQKDATRLEKIGHIKIGFVSCRISRRVMVTRCHRCFGYGHIGRDCQAVDRLNIFVIVSAEDVKNNIIDLNKEGNESINFINNSDVCHSAECYQIANDIWQSVNHSVNPCDNFHEYACGRFASSNPIPKEESAWSTIQKLRRTVKLRMLEIVMDGYNNSTDILPVKQMKKFYKSCTSYWKVGRRGLKHIKAFLAQIGGWPLIMEREEWSSMKISWQDINQFYSRLLFLSSFYRINVKSESKNSNDYTADVENSFKIIKIHPPTVPLKSMARYSGKIFNKNFTDMYDNGKYEIYIFRIANMLAFSRSAHISRKQLHEDVNNMIELEKKILNIPHTHDSEQPQYIKIDQLQEIYINKVKTPEKSKINWKKIITDYFNEAKVQLNGDELFQIANKQHFETLVEILENTDQRTLANYMHWHFVSYLLPYTTLFMEALRINMLKHKDGIENRPRWQNCIRNLEMPRVLAYEYAKKYMNIDSKDKVKKIFLSIQKEMVKHIEKADWLNDETKNNQLEKIENMKVNIGFPQWITNETSLIEMYQGLVIGNQYMENIISIKRLNAKRALQYLRSSLEIKE
ncbi:membrane metallo-endopeptidase-like 1 [Leptopilina heterotoma]|uniref:membrane metallo-endopeptidase-like 1 n=1 Tax=Leptopilina heterotoma TaxID=63436 RepID=UPI001CAA01B8|nr:membrane metallo-endopeptidase-like 1 [Leptopilina heterotoma]